MKQFFIATTDLLCNVITLWNTGLYYPAFGVDFQEEVLPFYAVEDQRSYSPLPPLFIEPNYDAKLFDFSTTIISGASELLASPDATLAEPEKFTTLLQLSVPLPSSSSFDLPHQHFSLDNELTYNSPMDADDSDSATLLVGDHESDRVSDSGSDSTTSFVDADQIDNGTSGDDDKPQTSLISKRIATTDNAANQKLFNAKL